MVYLVIITFLRQENRSASEDVRFCQSSSSSFSLELETIAPKRRRSELGQKAHSLRRGRRGTHLGTKGYGHGVCYWYMRFRSCLDLESDTLTNASRIQLEGGLQLTIHRCTYGVTYRLSLRGTL